VAGAQGAERAPPGQSTHIMHTSTDVRGPPHLVYFFECALPRVYLCVTQASPTLPLQSVQRSPPRQTARGPYLSRRALAALQHAALPSVSCMC